MKLIQRIAVFTIAGAMLTGCTASARHGANAADNSRTNVSFLRIMENLTPELQGLHERPVDVYRGLAISNSFHMRMLSDDLGRVFYTDHPSRLSPFPIISLNGNP